MQQAVLLPFHRGVNNLTIPALYMRLPSNKEQEGTGREEQGKQKPDTSELGAAEGPQCKLESSDSKRRCFSFPTLPLTHWLFFLVLSPF